MESVSHGGGVPSSQQTPSGARVITHLVVSLPSVVVIHTQDGTLAFPHYDKASGITKGRKNICRLLVPAGSLCGSWFCCSWSTARTNFLVEKACGRGMADMGQKVMETDKVSGGEYCPEGCTYSGLHFPS